MINIMLVDDEVLTADNLFEVLYNNLEQEEVTIYKFYSAVDALEMLKMVSVDIIISDMLMPGVNGMEFLHLTKQMWPECRFIFLTGCEDFNYIYESSMYENTKYILKIEGYDKIVQIAKESIDQIFAETFEQQMIDELKSRTDRLLEYSRKKYIRQLVREGKVESEAIKSYFEKYKISLDFMKDVWVVIIKPDNKILNCGADEVLKQIEIIIEKQFDIFFSYINYEDDKDNMIWLLQPNDFFEKNNISHDRIIVYVCESIEKLQQNISKFLEIDLSFIYTNTGVTWGNINHKINDLLLVLNYYAGNDQQVILSDSKFENAFNDFKEIFETNIIVNNNQFEVLETSLEVGDAKTYFETLERIFIPLSNGGSQNNTFAIEIYMKVVMMMLSYINKYKLLPKIVFDVNVYRVLRYYDFDNWDEAIASIIEIVKRVFLARSHDQSNIIRSTVDAVKKYIEQNYKSDVSLISLAQVVHLNPSYLSRLFKNEEGYNISDYINEVRIKKAKELMRDKHIKVQDMAEMLGYSNAFAFSRFFKKHTGLSPNEYRDLARKNINANL